MNIPIRDLKNELKNNVEDCKRVYSYDNQVITKSIFGLFSKLINKFEKTKSYQTGLFIKSMDDWINRENNENKPLDPRITTIQKGDIYMVDWNMGYSPELSYEHPCVVIDILENFIFALPVSSQPQYIEIGYHPINSKEGNRNYRIVEITDGFAKQCVIHLNQGKCISSTRILYKIGSLTVDENGTSDLYNEIKQYLIGTYFSDEYNKMLEENADFQRRIEFLDKQRKQYQSKADKFRNENEKLRSEIEELKRKNEELQASVDISTE